MRIAVTGSSGFIGTNIVTEGKKKHSVIPLTRKEFVLGQDISQQLSDSLKNIDVLIHCAYDFVPRMRKDIRRINVEGSKKLFIAAQKTKTKVIFLSSMSGFVGCKSEYGRAKLAIENIAKKMGVTIIKPGLVYAQKPKGIVGSLCSFAQKIPFIPVIKGGRQKLYLCHVKDLAQAIISIAEKKQPTAKQGTIVCANEEGIFFRDIIQRLSKRKLYFFSVPYTLLLFALNILEKTPLSFGLRKDSLIGLVNTHPQPDFSSTRKLKLQFRSVQK